MDQIRSLIDSITVSDVITWAMVVLVAGFIGQFGRKFAEHLIEKAKKKKQEPLRETGKREVPEAQKAGSIPPAGTGALPSSPKNDKEAKEQSKLEKKTAKALVKQKKKASPSD